MPQRFALFDYGFRALFLLARLEVVVAVAVWLFAFFNPGLWSADAIQVWPGHAHERMSGFVAAAVGSFLLASAPSWTGASGLPDASR